MLIVSISSSGGTVVFHATIKFYKPNEDTHNIHKYYIRAHINIANF